MGQSWYQLDWLWTTTGWLLAALGAALLLWALFSDRARGRRRCPKCWYDMSGVPVLRCPECGREATNERQLKRTRRRRLPACLAMLVLTGAAAIAITPAIRKNGWRSVLPTTLIIAMLPRAGTEHHFDAAKTRWTTDPFVEEMTARVERGELSSWQWSWALDRTGVIRTRSRWPQNLPLRVGLWPAGWTPGAETTATIAALGDVKIEQLSGLSFSGTGEPWRRSIEQYQEVAILPMSTRELRLDVTVTGGRSFGAILSGGKSTFSWSGPMKLHIRPVPTPEQAVDPVSGPTIDAAVKRATRVEVSTGNRSAGPTLDRHLIVYTDRSKASELRGIALGFVVDLLKNGTLIRTMRPDRGPYDLDNGAGVFLTLDDFHTNALTPEDIPQWAIRLRGDAEASLGHFDCEQYWAGRIDYPLKDVLSR